MRLFRLTFATILQRKSWAIFALAIVALPFVLPVISSATEKPVLIQPARILAAWNTLWIGTLVWGFFTAARQGEDNAKSGVGEYFLTTGISATRQLLEIWLAIFAFIVPMTLAAAAVCQFAASPADPVEYAAWWQLNLQYVCLFLLAVGPLLALAIALASRFGSIAGFAVTLGLTLYGLWGVGYLDTMLKLGENPVLQGLFLCSPQYRFADLTQRLHFKLGALPTGAFWQMCLYFSGILAVYAGISRCCFRIKSA